MLAHIWRAIRLSSFLTQVMILGCGTFAILSLVSYFKFMDISQLTVAALVLCCSIWIVLATVRGRECTDLESRFEELGCMYAALEKRLKELE